MYGVSGTPELRRLRIKKELVDAQYLYFALSEAAVRRTIMSVATQTALTGITTTDLFAVPVPIPEKTEQRKIAEILSFANEAIAKTEALAAKQQRIKQGLMQDLLAGGTRVTSLLTQLGPS